MFAPGDVLAGKYRIQRTLGEGGYGIVVAAEHIALGGRVAIKVLRPEMAKDHEVVERFLREGRAAVRIKGEHVTRVLDVGSTASGEPFMVMEYLDGHDLAQVVDTRGPLPIPMAVDYVLQACEALAEAHALGIIHRDIKPSNLFLTMTADGSACVKVLDFGISKLVAPDAESAAAKLTRTQAVLGSPQYMAPEQMRSSRVVDRRTDIWALGGTLFELLTGRPPFDAKTMAEIFAQILEDAPPQLTAMRRDAHPALAQIVARCLEKQPDRRFGDVHDLALALAPFSSTGAAAATRIERLGLRASQSSERARLPMPAAGMRAPARLEPSADMPAKRGWTVPALLGLVVGVVVLAGGWIARKKLHSAPPPALATSAPAPRATHAPEVEPPPPVTGVSALPDLPDAPPAEPSAVAPRRPAVTPPPHLKPVPSAAPNPSGVASSRYD